MTTQDQRIGSYRIEHELGVDSNGTSYLATHQLLRRRAVVKVMHSPSAYPLMLRKRVAVKLLREACILDYVQQPGVPRVYESGLDYQRPWFAHEFVDGPTLASFVSYATGSEPAWVLTIIRDLAQVLDEAARRAIVHCGVRPDRVLLPTARGGSSVCVVGWSEARLHDSSAQRPAPTPLARRYGSPELMAGVSVDDRSDVFSLGIIAHQLLYGTIPLAHRVPTPRCGDLSSPTFPALVEQMLAHDRHDRPRISEVLDTLSYLTREPPGDPYFVRAARGTARQRPVLVCG